MDLEKPLNDLLSLELMRSKVTHPSLQPLTLMAKLKQEKLLPSDICRQMGDYLIELLQFKHPAEVASDRGEGWSSAAIADKFKTRYKELEENMIELVRQSCE